MNVLNVILKIAGIAAAVVGGLFALTFTVYFFNLDMKLLSRIEPLFRRHYDHVKRDRHL